MKDDDLCKEYIRDAFHEGALDLGRERKFLEGFIRIFAGEPEAIIALGFATYLAKEELERLVPLAEMTTRSVAQFDTWRDRALKGSKARKA